MWSVLTDTLPEVIVVNGVQFGVETDFRVWIRAGQILNNAPDNPTAEVSNRLIAELYDLIVKDDEEPDGFIPGADFITAVTEFYAGPQKPEQDDSDEDPRKPKPVRTFDFEYDAGYVYQAFLQAYGLRMTAVSMHWWEFLTLFSGLMLTEGNSLNFVIGVRQKKLSDVPKGQRAAYGKMQKAFALPAKDGADHARNDMIDRLTALWSESEDG